MNNPPLPPPPPHDGCNIRNCTERNARPNAETVWDFSWSELESTLDLSFLDDQDELYSLAIEPSVQEKEDEGIEEDDPFADVGITTIRHMGKEWRFRQVRYGTHVYKSSLLADDEFDVDVCQNTTMTHYGRTVRRRRHVPHRRKESRKSIMQFLDEQIEMNADLLEYQDEERDRSKHRYNQKEARRRKYLQLVGKEPDGEITDEGEEFLSTIEVHANEISKDEHDPELVEQIDGIKKRVVESFKSVQEFSESVDDNPELQKWLHAIESMVVLAYDLSKARSLTDLIMATVSLAQKHTKRSLTYELFRIFNDWSETDPQSDEEGLSTIQMLDLIRAHEMPKKIGYLISAAMSICACEMVDIEWSIGGLELIKFEALHQQVKALDLIDAIIRTFQWVIETGTEVMRTGSLAPILYSKPSMAAYHNNYLELIRDFNKALHQPDFDVPMYIEKLDKAVTETANLAKVSKESLKLLYQRNYEKLLGMKEQVTAQLKGAEMRIAPFGMSLFGNSSVGKSTIAKLVMHQALSAGGYLKEDRTVDWHRVVTHDAYDEYDSTMYGSVLGLYLDDVANSKADRSKVNPARNIIRFFNNVAAPAIKAELNLKGVVFINFKVGVVTTNKKDLDAAVYSNCPESILRRLYHTTVVVKQDFTKADGVQLDSSNEKLAESPIVDAWDLKLEEIHTVKLGNGRFTYAFKPMVINSGTHTFNTEKLNIFEYLECVRILSKKHFAQQRHYITREREGNKMQALPCGRLPGSPFAASENEEDTSITIKPVEDSDSSSDNEEQDDDDAQSFDPLEDKYESADIEVQSTEIVTRIVKDAAIGAVKSTFSSMFGPWFAFYRTLRFLPVRKYETHLLQRELEQLLDAHAVPLVYAMIPSWVQNTRVGSFLQERFARGRFYMDTGRLIRYFGYGCGSQMILLTSPRIYEFALKPMAQYSQLNWLLYGLEFARRCYFSNVSLLDSLCLRFGMNLAQRRNASLVVLGLVSGTSFVAAKIASDARKRKIQDEFLARKDAIDVYAEQIRKSCIPKTLLVAGTVIIGLKGISMWNAYRLENLPQAMSPADVDKQRSWMGTMLESIGFKSSGTVRNASPSHVKNAIGKNLFHTTYECNDVKGACDIVFIKKYVAIVPKHIFYEDGDVSKDPRKLMDFSVRRNNKASSIFKFRVNYSMVTEIAMKDAVVMFVPNCPDVKDITKWLPEAHGSGTAHAHFLMRDEMGEIVSDTIAVKHGYTGHKFMKFDGGTYKTSLAKKGACMSVLYAESKHSSILGFHIGGNSDKEDGVMQTITQGQLKYAIMELEKTNEITISSSATELPQYVMGKPVLETLEIHPHAKIFHNLPEASAIDLHGSTRVRAQTKSQVIPSELTDTVKKLFGISNQWGPPKMNPNWKKYNATLEHVVNPIDHFDPVELLRAKHDYIKPLLEKARGRKDIKVLTDKETILGQDGKRFVDALPMKTSMGFPIFGPKRKYFTEILDGEKVIDRVPDKIITDEVARMKSCWLKGERAYSICTATLKDEPTPLDKDKVRVFQASNVAMSLCIRKYFLPIVRFLGLHPIDSESAVGVNAVGKQWQELMDYAKSKSTDGEMMAADYSKYDVRMSSQLTYTAWTIMIEIAAACGYAEEDLNMMRNMVTDIIHPVIDWNGTLLTTYNINTSGNNCTVQINDIVNSLLVRMGLFDSCPETEEFRDHVALVTYGDDLISSRDDEVGDRFHFESYQKFLGDKNMKITLPSKTDEIRKTLPMSECDFLKRRSNYIPEIDRELGALDEMSIFKSLHANLKSKTQTPKEVAISCVETAMHEWFAHGRALYEDRQQKMLEVCAHHKLAVPAVHLTFDERVQRWKDAYD